MKAKEIREMGLDEMRAKAKDLTTELFNFRIQHSTGQMENPIKLRDIKKDIARFKTIITEKERQS